MLALVCYAFLPFYEVALQGSVSGIEFTAGHISHATGLMHVLGALLPFIAGFAAIAFNTLKHRYWSIGVMVAIVACIMFLVYTGHTHDIALTHEPEIVPIDNLGEGFAITALGWGNKLSLGLFVAALVSAIVSLMPFSFNQVIERAVDDTIDRSLEGGRRHIRAIEDEWKRRRRPRRPSADEGASQPEDNEQQQSPVQEAPEDYSRFMPK